MRIRIMRLLVALNRWWGGGILQLCQKALTARLLLLAGVLTTGKARLHDVFSSIPLRVRAYCLRAWTLSPRRAAINWRSSSWKAKKSNNLITFLRVGLNIMSSDCLKSFNVDFFLKPRIEVIGAYVIVYEVKNEFITFN